MEAYRSLMIGFKRAENGKTGVSLGDAEISHVFGWVDEGGLYLWTLDGTLVQVSGQQLMEIVDFMDIVRISRIKKEKEQEKNKAD